MVSNPAISGFGYDEYQQHRMFPVSNIRWYGSHQTEMMIPGISIGNDS